MLKAVNCIFWTWCTSLIYNAGTIIHLIFYRSVHLNLKLKL